jgi:hypothetical protein
LDNWNMTLIDGPDVSHLTLQPDGDPNGPQASQFWRVDGLPVNRAPSAPSPPPARTSPDAGKGTGNGAAPDSNNSNGKAAKTLRVS